MFAIIITIMVSLNGHMVTLHNTSPQRFIYRDKCIEYGEWLAKAMKKQRRKAHIKSIEMDCEMQETFEG